MLRKFASLENAEVKVEAERGSDCPHLSLSLSLDLSLPRGNPAWVKGSHVESRP